MEIYTLDALFRREEVIDDFTSLIWTERWAGWGDFELSTRSSSKNTGLFKTGMFIACDVSHRIMKIETIDSTVSKEGVREIKIKGRSAESFFEDRALYADWSNVKTQPPDLINNIFNAYFITGFFSQYDVMDNFVLGRHPALPADSTPPIMEDVQTIIKKGTFYSVLQQVTNTWNLGFRLLLNRDTGKLHFDVYSGVDRTASQTQRDPVIFSQSLENLQNTSELETIEGSKAVARVMHNPEVLYVYAENYEEDTTGFERRIIAVDATDIDIPTGQARLDAMRQRGMEALAENRPLKAFDGEINERSQYVYNRDYYLGDLVEIRGEKGSGNQMRVTEQIFVSDQQGERSYPTLTLNKFVRQGSWLGWPTDKKWIDYDPDTTTTWSTLP